MFSFENMKKGLPFSPFSDQNTPDSQCALIAAQPLSGLGRLFGLVV